MSDEIKVPPTFKLTEQYYTLQQFYDFHPESFEDLDEDEMKLLKDVYLINDESNKSKNIDKYLRKTFDEDKELPKKLQPILTKIGENIRLREGAKDFFLFDDEDLQQ